MSSRAKGGKTVLDSIMELIDNIAEYVRLRVKEVIDQSITGPLTKAGRKVAFFILAFSLFSLASIFLAVGLFLALAHVMGYILAYLAIGIVLVIAGIVILRQGMKDRKIGE